MTMEKPIPCKKTMIKMSNEEFVQRMSVNNIAISILTKCGNCNTILYFFPSDGTAVTSEDC